MSCLHDRWKVKFRSQLEVVSDLLFYSPYGIMNISKARFHFVSISLFPSFTADAQARLSNHECTLNPVVVLMSKIVMYTIQVVSFRYLVHRTFYNNYCTLENINIYFQFLPNLTRLFLFLSFEIYYFNGSLQGPKKETSRHTYPPYQYSQFCGI